MKNTPLLFALFLLLYSPASLAQSLQQKVTFKYANEKLGTVLKNISNSYDVSFTYSSYYIPVNQLVTVNIANQPLSVALDDISNQTGIVYATIGDQIVLKKEQKQLSQINTLPSKVKQNSPIYPLSPQEQKLIEQMKRERERNMASVKKPAIREVGGGDSIFEEKIDAYKLAPLVISKAKEDDYRLAQVSILPFVGTNALKSSEITNNLSFNLFWGTNGGVDGLEVGGFNHIIYDVKGVQVGGLGNLVHGEVVGTQVGGAFNIGAEKMQGVQVGGLFNISGETDAVQTAGAFNITKEFAGIQVAGFFNVSAGKADGLQAAGLFNVAGGKTKTQVASLFNMAGDVEVGQMSTLLNVGKKVGGFQVGLINVADSISGIPIGLFNFIKKGYNRVEFAAGEALYANFALKFGAHSFYNIIQIGGRWDEVSRTHQDGTAAEELQITWGLGYGLGTVLTLSPKTLMNIEAVAIQVNEREFWTKELNLLNQLRLYLDFRTGRRTSIFAGPTGNIMVSKRTDTESGIVGSSIAPYAFHDKTNEHGNVKMWVGFNAGIRF